jgi:glycosyltransferase involved in cell wall biosynthesis
MSEIEKKFVSVVIPVQNEEKYIAKCLDSLVNQDYSAKNYEIIIVDGMSSDNTRSILRNYQSKFKNLVKVYDNPYKIQVVGRNIGIRKSNSHIVIMFSAHAFVHNNYLSTISKAFADSGDDIAAIGANIFDPDDEKLFGKVIGKVQMSLLGGAGTGFRLSKKNRIIDSPGFPAYKKEIIEKIGLFDEKFENGEDSDLNWRIKKAGFKLMVCSDAITYYYRRHNSFAKLAKRLFNYGVGRAIFVKKHPTSFKIMTAIPLILIISLLVLPISYLSLPSLFKIISVGFLLYLFAICISSVNISLKQNNFKYLLSFPIYLVEHFSFGFGLLIELLRFSKYQKR